MKKKPSKRIQVSVKSEQESNLLARKGSRSLAAILSNDCRCYEVILQAGAQDLPTLLCREEIEELFPLFPEDLPLEVVIRASLKTNLVAAILNKDAPLANGGYDKGCIYAPTFDIIEKLGPLQTIALIDMLSTLSINKNNATGKKLLEL